MLLLRCRLGEFAIFLTDLMHLAYMSRDLHKAFLIASSLEEETDPSSISYPQLLLLCPSHPAKGSRAQLPVLCIPPGHAVPRSPAAEPQAAGIAVRAEGSSYTS